MHRGNTIRYFSFAHVRYARNSEYTFLGVDFLQIKQSKIRDKCLPNGNLQLQLNW